MSIVSELAEMRIEGHTMRSHAVKFGGQRIKLGMHLIKPLEELRMLHAQLIPSRLMVILCLAESVKMLRGARDVDIEFIGLMDLLQLAPELLCLVR
jgi:hypothetical protein